MDPALAFAVFRRLTGYPCDAKGHPLLDPATGLPLNIEGSRGLRVPMAKQAAASIVPDSATQDAFRFGARGFHGNQYVQVPVYFEGTDTKRWRNVFPSCSISVSDVQLGGDPYLFDPDEQDGIGEDSGENTITNSVTGYSFTTPAQRITRKSPEPWDVFITFSLLETDTFKMMMLERAFLALFKQKGAIEVEQLDGTFRALDLFFDRYAVMDQGEPYDPQQGTSEEARAFLKRSYTFRCETSHDNSVAGFNTYDFTTQYMIESRTLEMATLAADLTERVVRTLQMEILTP